jgi:broad specificity phosphatase PhoE
MRRLPILAAAAGLALSMPLIAESPTTVVIVRHAEKAADQGKDPNLTEAGEARAKLLARLLGAMPLGGLYSSEFHRTRETLVPLAEASGVEIRTIPARETANTLTAERLLSDHPGQLVVVASHSNLAPGIVTALTGEPLPEIDESVYDDLFVVSLHTDGTAHFVRLKYGKPPPY